MKPPLVFADFTKTAIPESGGLYVLLGHPHLGKYQVLYVGQANDLRRRFGEHLNSDDLRIQQEVFYYDYELQPNQYLRNQRERELINLYNPRINTMLKPKLVPQPLAPKLQKLLPHLPLKTQVAAKSPQPDLFAVLDRQKRLRELEQNRRRDALLNALKKFS